MIMLLRFYNRKKIPMWKKYADSILVAIWLILIWKWVWNIADYVFSFLWNIWLENLASFIVWTAILVLTDRFVEQFIDD